MKLNLKNNRVYDSETIKKELKTLKKKKKIKEIYTDSSVNRQLFQGFLIRTALMSNAELIEFEIINML